MKPVKIAVIGAGYWGRKVIREIVDLSRTNGNVELRAVVDNSPTCLEQCQREFGGLDYRLDYRTLLKDPELDAVHISTPNATHFEVASAFLRDGKHALVEKPLTLTPPEAYQLLQLAREKGRVLCTGHIHRFNNGVKELQRAISSGILGELYYLRLEWTGFLLPQSQREVITDLAPHPFDISNYLLGTWPTKISCRGKGFRTKGNEEVAFINTEYSNGLYMHIEVSWLDRQKRRNVTVVGSEGIARLDCGEQTAVLQHGDKTEKVDITPSNTLRLEINHFADCINHNSRSESYANQSDGLLGAQVVTLLDAARESLRQERTVQVQFPVTEEVRVR
jgi:UDP-N-acetylglucosamine 3-dehydrogenase